MFDLDGLWNLQAVKMTSIKTQLPFEYYSIPICKPDNLQYKPENLGRADFLHFFILYLDHSANFCNVQLKKLIFMIHYIVYLFDGKHGKKVLWNSHLIWNIVNYYFAGTLRLMRINSEIRGKTLLLVVDLCLLSLFFFLVRKFTHLPFRVLS